MTRALKIFASLVFLLVCAFAGVTGTQALLSLQETEKDLRGAGATPVGVASPEKRRIEDVLTATGTIRPIRSVELVPNAPGRVTSVPVSSGQKVEAGDLLVQLDDRAARASLKDAEATLSEARQSYNRIERLAQGNAAAESQLEGARATLLRAEAAKMGASADLEDRAIMAPFAGILGVIDIDEGAYLDGTSPVTRLLDLSTVEVRASLPEQHFDRVEPGQTLQVTTPAYPGETFEGRVTLRAPEIDQWTRNFEIRAEIDNSDARLAGGMFAHVRLLLETYDGIVIPDAAIISEGLESYVYTVADGVATRTDIDPGRSLGELTEVREGMNLDDRVVVAGWDQLSDGSEVDITGREASETSE